MVKSPSKFYYSPIGKWWTSTFLYCIYVAVVTIVVQTWTYLYEDWHGLEIPMWIMNAGYVCTRSHDEYSMFVRALG